MHRTMYIAHPYPGEVWEHSRIAKIPGHSKIFPIGGAYFIPSYKTYLPNTGGPWKSVALVHKLNLSTLHRNRCLRPVCCVKTKTWYWIQEPYMTIYVFRHKYIRFTFHMIIYVYVGRKVNIYKIKYIISKLYVFINKRCRASTQILFLADDICNTKLEADDLPIILV